MLPFNHILHPVGNHVAPPADFLSHVKLFVTQPSDVPFAPNEAKHDLYAAVKPYLAPDGWPSIIHRRAAMAACMVVHAAHESDFKWHEGKDPANHNPDPLSWEAGVFQISLDSRELSTGLAGWLESRSVHTYDDFRAFMMGNHTGVIEYYARLVRVSVTWAGPYNRGEVQRDIHPDAYAEWVAIITEALNPPAEA